MQTVLDKNKGMQNSLASFHSEAQIGPVKMFVGLGHSKEV